MKLLRVYIREDGVVVFNHGAFQNVDEGWWSDVLHDPRASAPRADYIDWPSPYRLDRQKEWIDCRCRCGLHHWMDRDKLIKEVGGNINILYLVREWMPCRGTRNRMSNHCEAYVVI